MGEQTITIEQVEQITGAKTSRWERGSMVRHYVNVAGAAYKAWMANDGKLHFDLGKGRSTEHANAIAKSLLGCNPTDRYSRSNGPAAYVVVEG